MIWDEIDLLFLSGGNGVFYHLTDNRSLLNIQIFLESTHFSLIYLAIYLDNALVTE